MAFKFVVIAVLIAVAQAGLLASQVNYETNPAVDAVATIHQNVIRSLGGTVSQYSKSVETPYSTVRKEDTRISNNVYTPAIAKSVAYAAPAITKTITYAAPSPAPTAAVYTHAAPVVTKTVYNSPAPTAYAHHHVTPAVYTHHVPASASTALYTHVAPTLVKSVAAPVYHHETPVVKTTYNHRPAATTYTHNSPGVAAYGASQSVHYSPAETVSHMSFNGFGTHWGF